MKTEDQSFLWNQCNILNNLKIIYNGKVFFSNDLRYISIRKL